jgi:hypothetical protein
MTQKLATPLAITESFFETKLNERGVKSLLCLKDTDARWIDFAVHYADTMENHFAEESLSIDANRRAPVRLFFEPRLRDQWDAAIELMGHPTTPLLGLGIVPQTKGIDANTAAALLGPLKKHLLIGDSVYIADNFYQCFFYIKERASNPRSGKDPDLGSTNPNPVRNLKAWLPFLRQLRPLIETDALVFMPDFIKHWFPGGTQPPEVKAAFANLRVRPGGDPEPPAPPGPPPRLNPEAARLAPPPVPPTLKQSLEDRLRRVNASETVGAFVNARLMGLDSVFPSREVFDFASRLYLAEEDGPGETGCDLTSLDIVPLGRKKPLSIKDLVSLRKNEEGFEAVRDAVVACEAMLREPVACGADPTLVVGGCREEFDRRIAAHTGRVGRVLKRADNLLPNTAIALSVGAVLIPTAAISPFLAPFAVPFIAPGVARKAAEQFNAPVRALSKAKALL